MRGERPSSQVIASAGGLAPDDENRLAWAGCLARRFGLAELQKGGIRGIGGRRAEGLPLREARSGGSQSCLPAPEDEAGFALT